MRNFITIIILVLNSGICFAEDTPEISIPESGIADKSEAKGYADIRDLIDAGKLVEAEALCNSLLEENPEDTEALLLHSEIMIELERYLEALTDMDFAIALVPDEPEHYLRRSYVKFMMGSFEDALQDMKYAVNYGIKSPSSYEYYGRLLVSLGAYDEARTKYDYTLEHDPYFYKALQGRAVVELLKDDYTAACMDIERMLQNSEVDEYAHFSKARLFEEQHNDYEQALIELAIALEINPNFYGGYKMRMKYFNKLEMYDRAIEDAQFLISVEQGGADAWYTKAYAQGRIGKQADAILSLNRAISMSPEVWTYYRERAVNLYELERYREAIPDYAIYYENTNSPQILIYRGYCYHMTKEYDKAIADYTAFLDIYPHSWEVYKMRADSYFAKGEIRNATKDMIKLAELKSGGDVFIEDYWEITLYSLALFLAIDLVVLCVVLRFRFRKNKPVKVGKAAKKPPPLPPTGA